jgi:hypothetical protein
MSFKLKYQAVPKKPNPMVQINPLKKGTEKIVNLQDRVDKLNNSSAWKKTVKAWKATGKKFDLDRIPKFGNFKLGRTGIAEDIQRTLDEKHCANKIGNPALFDPALLQPIQCILTSKGEMLSVNSQHTASTIAGLIDAGLVNGHTDWKEFEYPFWYLETDDLAFARRAFGIHNGKGSKPQSEYQKLRNAIFVVRLDKDTSDPKEVALEKKVATAEKYKCFPVEEKSNLANYPGTFTNISTFETLNVDEISVSCAWHNKYFHYETVHVSLFFIFREICRQFKSAKIKITPKLEEELAALVQSLFGNLAQFQESVKEAHRRWTEKRYGYQANWDDDAYSCALVQLYQKFGGTEKVALTLLDQFDGLIDFFDEDILNLA